MSENQRLSDTIDPSLTYQRMTPDFSKIDSEEGRGPGPNLHQEDECLTKVPPTSIPSSQVCRQNPSSAKEAEEGRFSILTGFFSIRRVLACQCSGFEGQEPLSVDELGQMMTVRKALGGR